MNPGTHTAAQEKWGGERRETAEGGEEGEESKVEKPPLLFEAMTLSLVRSLTPSSRWSLPSSFPPQLQLSQMTRRFHDLGRQTDRPNERNHEYTQGDHPSGSFGSKPHNEDLLQLNLMSLDIRV